MSLSILLLWWQFFGCHKNDINQVRDTVSAFWFSERCPETQWPVKHDFSGARLQLVTPKRRLTQNGPRQMALAQKQSIIFIEVHKKIFPLLISDTLIKSYPWPHLDFSRVTESRVGMKTRFLSNKFLYFSSR